MNTRRGFMVGLAAVATCPTQIIAGIEGTTKTGLTPAQKDMLKPWYDKWAEFAMRTRPQDDHDREVMVKAVKGLYKAANLDEPEVYFTASPVSGEIVGGSLFYAIENDVPLNTNIQTTNTIILEAIRVLRPILEARDLLKDTPTPVVLDDTKKKWGRQACIGMLPGYPEETIAALAQEIKDALDYRSPGNLDSNDIAYISFLRHVVKTDIDYTDYWDHYEKGAIHGGCRFMYLDFCVVSDFPTQILFDENDLAHNASGPSHAWSDGFEIYNWHGTLVPLDYHWIIKEPHWITKKTIEAETNPDMKRIMREMAQI